MASETAHGSCRVRPEAKASYVEFHVILLSVRLQTLGIRSSLFVPTKVQIMDGSEG